MTSPKQIYAILITALFLLVNDARIMVGGHAAEYFRAYRMENEPSLILVERSYDLKSWTLGWCLTDYTHKLNLRISQ